MAPPDTSTRIAVVPRASTPPSIDKGTYDDESDVRDESAIVEKSELGPSYDEWTTALEQKSALEARVAELETYARELEHALETERADVQASLTFLARAKREIIEGGESELVRLAFSIAERVVGETVTNDPALILDWAKEELAQLNAESAHVVAVGVELAKKITSETVESMKEAGARLEIDSKLPPLGCEVRDSFTRIDAGAESRLRAVGAALGVEE